MTRKRVLEGVKEMRHRVVFRALFPLLGLVIIGCTAASNLTTKPTVIIQSPPSGSVYVVGEEVVVQSTSTDPAGIVRVQMLVNGMQVRDDPSPVAQGQAQFSLLQTWIAAAPGQHTITVRAVNSQGVSSESGIIVNVREQAGQQPTSAAVIATAVPLATSTSPPTSVPTTPPQTIVVSATPAPTSESPTPTLTATQPAPPPCTDKSQFVTDVTIPDGTIFSPNAVFTKTWRVKNNGTCSWDDYSLVFMGGAQMASGSVYPVPPTLPGATADITVPMTAPSSYGAYTGIWRIRNQHGQLFGTQLTVVINVPSPATQVPPTIPAPTAAPGPCSGQPNDFSFTASDTDITAGESTTLGWGPVTNATGAFLDGGEFSNEGVETPGNRVVSPVVTTVYSLKAVCSVSGQTRTHQVTINVSGPPPGTANFAGNWNHNFGTMSLVQAGTNVNGIYTKITGGSDGTIEGTVSGNTLNGTWTSGGGSGTLQFVMGGSNKTFTGNFDGAVQWCGARVGEKFPNGCAFAGHWNTEYDENGNDCDMNLEQVGTSITGTYCNGTVSGTVSYQAGFLVINGSWKITNLNQGSLKFYLQLYGNKRFQGNYNNDPTNHPWCGWRNDSSKPNPCGK